MTKAQIDALSIGEAFAWDITNREIQRSDETAIAHRIDGPLPPGLVAELRPTQGFGRWAFYVRRDSESLHPENSYDSKQEAFTALKEWLAKRGQ